MTPLKTAAFFAQGEQLRFALADAEKASYLESKLCQCLGVSRSGYYAWSERPVYRHRLVDPRLRVKVREAFERNHHTYGSPRVHAELQAEGSGVKTLHLPLGDLKLNLVRASCEKSPGSDRCAGAQASLAAL